MEKSDIIMFFRKKKNNIQKQTKAQINKSDNKINVGSNVINSENKISTISQNLQITGTLYSPGKISFNGSMKGSLESNHYTLGRTDL